MEEASSLCCKAGPDHITEHQNTALPKRELSEPARLQNYTIPFSGVSFPSDVPERALGHSTAGHCCTQSLYDWAQAVTPDGKGHLASLSNAPLGRSDVQLELNDLLRLN